MSPTSSFGDSKNGDDVGDESDGRRIDRHTHLLVLTGDASRRSMIELVLHVTRKFTARVRLISEV